MIYSDDPGGPPLSSIRWDRADSATTVSVLRSKGVGPVAMKMKLLFQVPCDPMKTLAASPERGAGGPQTVESRETETEDSETRRVVVAGPVQIDSEKE